MIARPATRCSYAGAIALLAWLAPGGGFVPGSSFVPGGAFAQTAQDPIALSPGCKAPSSDIATPAPLPHLAGKLKDGAILRVLAIGSASTAGIGASSAAQGYTAQLEQILERTFKGLDVIVINRGVSGEAAAMTSSRLKNEVALTRPDLVLWQLGTNDALARVPVDEFAATVRETLDWLKDHHVDTVLVGLQYGRRVATDEHYAAIREALREVAASENILLIRRWEAMKYIEGTTDTKLQAGDDLHLNDLGYQCMAEHIARTLVASAFLRNGPPPPRP